MATTGDLNLAVDRQASPLTAVPLTTPTADMRVVRVDRLGGLIHEYAQAA